MDETTAKSGSPMTTHVLWIVGIVLGLVLSLQQFLTHEGILLDDELTHFVRSRSAWHNLDLVFDAWTRPGRNLFHMVAAPFGLTATRLYTVTWLLVGMFATAYIAKHLKLSHVELVPMLFFFQQWVVELGYGVLTQTPFLVVWVLAVLFHLKGRHPLAALFFGYLLLVRHEGIALSASYMVLCAWNRKFVAAAIVPVPAILLNVAAWLCSVRLPMQVYFDAKPTEMYGSGTLWHYVLPTAEMVGVSLAILAVIGLPRMLVQLRNYPVLLTYPLYFVVHSVIFWRGLFASGGYVYFLMPMAPFFVWIALCGVATVLRWVEKIPAWSLPLREIVVATFLVGLFVQSYVKPRRLVLYSWANPSATTWLDFLPYALSGSPVLEDGMRQPVRDAILAVDAVTNSDKANQPNAQWQTASMSPYFHYRTDQIQTPSIRPRQWIGIDRLPPRTLFVWEAQYAPYSKYTRENFDSAGWGTVAEFSDERVVIYSNAASDAKRILGHSNSGSISLASPGSPTPPTGEL